MDCTSLKEWIPIIAGIGTFISALIAAFTVIEIKKQRRSSYMPDIILDSYVAYCYWNRTFNEDIFFQFKREKYNDWRNKTLKQNEEEDINIFILYKLQNIGLGVAKYVNCDWKFDYKKAIKKVNEVIPDDYRIQLSDEKITLIKGEDEFLDFSYFSDLSPDHTDFIHPELVKPNLKDSTIPQLVINLHLYYFIFKYRKLRPKNSDFDIDKFDSFPTLKLSVKFQDIRNKSYKKKFQFSFEFYEFSEKEEQNDEDEFGMFYIYLKEK